MRHFCFSPIWAMFNKLLLIYYVIGEIIFEFMFELFLFCEQNNKQALKRRNKQALEQANTGRMQRCK